MRPTSATKKILAMPHANTAFLAGLVLALLSAGPAMATISGICSNCHTMHNSQDGSAMATFGTDGEAGPNPYLTRGTCTGCHAQGTGDNILVIGTSQIPQVRHTNANDLAAGNFAYINGEKGSGSSAAKGHNVVDIFGADSDAAIDAPPGSINQSGHVGPSAMIVDDSNLTCAGANGCHGTRNPDGASGLPALKGAHHGNVDGQCATADTVANSYRFLKGVKGFENQTNKWRNVDGNSHNEYYGAATPPILGCSGGELSCHTGGFGGPVQPPGNTISTFCGTCHGLFHTLTGPAMAGWEGIGTTTSSPFKRHPTDIVLPADVSKEYKDYTSYNVNAPVARQAVAGAVSATVTPGSDVVTCLSCHLAHASNYPDMLRWDYSGMNAHSGAGAGTGCFICHTTKDDV